MEHQVRIQTTVIPTFEIVEDQVLDIFPQYFVIYGFKEGAAFKDTQIFGFTNAEELNRVLDKYKQTGVLELPRWDRPRIENGEFLPTYDIVEPSFAFAVSATRILRRIPRYQAVEREVYLPK